MVLNLSGLEVGASIKNAGPAPASHSDSGAGVAPPHSRAVQQCTPHSHGSGTLTWWSPKYRHPVLRES